MPSPPQAYAIKIFLLINHFIKPLPRPPTQHIPLQAYHHVLLPPICDNFINTFQLSHPYFSSPPIYPLIFAHINHHIWEMNVWLIWANLLYPLGRKWLNTNCIIVLEALKQAIVATQTNPNTTNVITLTHNNWLPNNLNLLQQRDWTPMSTIAPLTLQYTHPQHFQSTKTWRFVYMSWAYFFHTEMYVYLYIPLIFFMCYNKGVVELSERTCF